MSFDILESFNAALDGPVIRHLSSSLGETEEGTRKAVRSVGPSMLAGLIQRVATPAGAAEMFRAVNDDHIDSGIVGKLGKPVTKRNVIALETATVSTQGSVATGRKEAHCFCGRRACR